MSDFFKLNGEFTTVNNSAELIDAIKDGAVSDLLYAPRFLSGVSFESVVFKNVSFSDTTLIDVAFYNCRFVDCLFVGTVFDRVNMHDCEFIRANFFRCRFVTLYAKPSQFDKAIHSGAYADVALHLYQQLREVYQRTAQFEYKDGADYSFRRWERVRNYNENVRGGRSRLRKAWGSFEHLVSLAYDCLLGYGYSCWKMIVSVSFLLCTLIAFNYVYTHHLFKAPVEPSLVKTIYFTLTTMSTVGAAGYTPDTDFGYFCVILNVFFGVTILSAVFNVIVRRLIR